MLAFVDLQEQLSDEHFTVDDTLTEAASLNSFRPRDADEATGTAERDGFQCSRMRRANTDPIPPDAPGVNAGLDLTHYRRVSIDPPLAVISCFGFPPMMD